MTDLQEEIKKMEKYDADVLVVGAGGAGLRAAIEASNANTKVIVVTKSLLGKAHTVMAEGGAAAALGMKDERDNWKVHFRDTMRGGKLHGNWKMAEIHAKQAPQRILELEKWGAVFDRTTDGKINQRNFGGHKYPRLAHVGDRTGLEMIRALQDHVVHEDNVEVLMETTITHLIKKENRVIGAVGYRRDSGNLVLVRAKAIILGTGGIGKAYKITSNSWEYTGDGHSLAFNVGADIIDMVFVQFHPTGMVYPSSVKGILVTEGVRGEGGILRNSEGERFMFRYIPKMFEGEYATTEEEAKRWLADNNSGRRPPELLTRDVVAKAILSEVKAGRGSTHGGAYLDIASQRSPEYIKQKLPSMYHQFKTLAGLDITKEPMEVGPTTHYIMGGIRVHPETQSTTVSGLYAAGEVSAGLHGANRLGGNSLSDLLVFGALAGEHARNYSNTISKYEEIDNSILEPIVNELLEPFKGEKTENPYLLHRELQHIMGDFVGIIRNEKDLTDGIEQINKLIEKSKSAGAKQGRKYNPSWHQALDLKSMLITSLLLAHAALARKESRGGHTRDDFPETNKELTQILYVLQKDENDGIKIHEEKMEDLPDELHQIIQGGDN